MMKTVFDPAGKEMSAPGARLHIGLILWPQFSLLALSGILEALRYAAKAKREMSFKISIISENPTIPLRSSAGISVIPDVTHVPPDSFDYVAVMGESLETLEQGYRGDREYLARVRQASVPLVGIGAGSFVLAQEGILNERRASIHPSYLERFRHAFPQVYVEQGFDFIDEGDVLTCPGGMSTIPLATRLIRTHAGCDIASIVCERLSLVSHEIATSRPVNIARIPDSRLRRAVVLIEQYLTRPLSIAGLASEVALSERQLNRLFHAEFGKTTREFIRSARLRYACWLLKNSRQSVTNIARRMGFSDCAHFIRYFQSEYGCTPGAWRTSRR